MDFTKVVVLMVLASGWFRPCCNYPKNSTRFDDQPFRRAQNRSWPESPYMCPESPVFTPKIPLKRNESVSWHRAAEQVASFALTFSYCHCNFILGFEQYTWTQLISNSVLSLLIHPFIYCSSWVLDLLIP